MKSTVHIAAIFNSFIYSFFNKHFSNTYYMPGIEGGTGENRNDSRRSQGLPKPDN